MSQEQLELAEKYVENHRESFFYNEETDGTVNYDHSVLLRFIVAPLPSLTERTKVIYCLHFVVTQMIVSETIQNNLESIGKYLAKKLDPRNESRLNDISRISYGIWTAPHFPSKNYLTQANIF